MNDQKSKISIQLTRKEVDWLLNLLTIHSRTESEKPSEPRLRSSFMADALADRIRAEG
jgi:hypothetical protein